MLSGLENPLHLAILILVVFLVFGAKRIPEMARGLGSGMREFREGITSGPPPHNTTGPSPADTQTRGADHV